MSEPRSDTPGHVVNPEKPQQQDEEQRTSDEVHEGTSENREQKNEHEARYQKLGQVLLMTFHWIFHQCEYL